MRTRFVPGDVPLNEYPRPQLVRGAWQNLNGKWDYAVRPAGANAPERWDGTILVPFCIESELSGVQRALHPGEALWYRRRFSSTTSTAAGACCCTSARWTSAAAYG